MIRELTQYLTGADPSLVVGKTIFAEFRPESAPAACHLVRLTGGNTDPLTDRVVQASVQLLSRGLDAISTLDATLKIHDYLIGKRGKPNHSGFILPQLNPKLCYQVEAALSQARPQGIGFDEKRRHLYSTNFTLHVVKVPV